MAQISEGGGGFSEEEARRRAAIQRLAQNDPNAGSTLTEGFSAGESAAPSSAPTVTSRADRDLDIGARGSALDQTQQQDILRRIAQTRESQNEARSFFDRFNAEQTRPNPPPAIRDEGARGIPLAPEPQRFSREDRDLDIGALGGPPQGGTPGRYRTLTEQGATPQQVRDIRAASERPGSIVRTDVPLPLALRQTATQQELSNPLSYLNAIVPGIPTGAAPQLLSGVAGRVGEALSPLATAIARRLGRTPSAFENAAQIGARTAEGVPTSVASRIGTLGPEAAEAAGKGFRLVGAVDDAASLTDKAARARSAAAGLREAATPPRTFAPSTPFGEAVKNRLVSLPTPVKVAAPIGAATAALTQVPTLLGAESGPQDVNAQPTQQEQKQGQQPPGPTLQPLTQPLPVQGPQNTPGTQLPVVPPAGPGVGPGPAAPGPGVPPAGPVPAGPAPRPGAPPAGPGAPPLPGGKPPAPPLPGGKFPVPGAQPPLGGQPPVPQLPGGQPPGALPSGPQFGQIPTFSGPAGRQAPPQVSDIQQAIMGDLNGLVQQINAGPQTPDVMALYASQAEKILGIIAEQEKQLRADAATAGQVVDPATQNMIDQLKEALGEQLKKTREALAARGLLNSGILIEAEQMLRKGNLSDQARLMAERLTRIQDNLTASLGTLRGQRVSTAQQYGMAGLQAQTQAEQAERQRLQELRGQVLQGRLGLSQQIGQQYEAEASRQQQAYEGEQGRGLQVYLQQIDQQFRSDQAAAERAFAAVQAGIAAAQRGNDVSAEREWKSRESEIQRQWDERQSELTRAQQAALAQAAAQNKAAGQTPSANDSRLATDNVISQISQFPDRPSAVSAMNGARGQSGYEAVNWLEVQNAIDQLFPTQQSGGFKWPWEK